MLPSFDHGGNVDLIARRRRIKHWFGRGKKYEVDDKMGGGTAIGGGDAHLMHAKIYKYQIVFRCGARR